MSDAQECAISLNIYLAHCAQTPTAPSWYFLANAPSTLIVRHHSHTAIFLCLGYLFITAKQRRYTTKAQLLLHCSLPPFSTSLQFKAREWKVKDTGRLSGFQARHCFPPVLCGTQSTVIRKHIPICKFSLFNPFKLMRDSVVCRQQFWHLSCSMHSKKSITYS